MRIAPSLLSADFGNLLAEALEVQPGVDRFHWDVMDGHFVPNLTFGPPVVNALRGRLALPFGIHLMIDHPAEYAPQFKVNPSDTIVFHIESADPAEETLAAIASTGAQSGLSFRPGTPISSLAPYLDHISMILVMSVEPGFGGQAFMPEALLRIRDLRKMVAERDIEIAVDGGIHSGNVADVISAGADGVIAGSAVFGAKDRGAAIQALRDAIE